MSQPTEPPPAPRISRLARLGRREPGRLSASWHWPARPGKDHSADTQTADTPPAKAQTADTQAEGPGTPAPTFGLEALGLLGPRQTWQPAAADPQRPDAEDHADVEQAEAHAESDVSEMSAGETGELTAVDLTAVARRILESPILAWIRPASAAVVRWTRDKTLESVATILLGVGGVIFPPIWLLGAMVALASRVWDYRDKWVGLAVPIVLTIVGTAAGVILAGHQSSFGHDLHIGWVSADIASRVSAALGAAYLAWRSVHGRRPDAVPPWNKPYGVG